jgi:hypothetical protein
MAWLTRWAGPGKPPNPWYLALLVFEIVGMSGTLLDDKNVDLRLGMAFRPWASFNSNLN